MGLSRELSHSTTDGQGNPTLADINAALLEALKDTRGGLLELVDLLTGAGWSATAAAIVEQIQINDVAIAKAEGRLLDAVPPDDSLSSPTERDVAGLREALVDLVSWFDGGPSSHGPWIIQSGEQGADDAVAAARTAVTAAGGV